MATDNNDNEQFKKRFRTQAELSSLKDDIIRKLDLRNWYDQHLLGQKTGPTKSSGFIREHVHCCLHNDTGKPNLSLNLMTGGFKCFGCGKAGSVFDFWCYLNNKDPKDGFVEAMISLAEIAGVDIKADRVLPATPTDGACVPPPLYKHKYVLGDNKADKLDISRPALSKKSLDKYKKCLQAEHYKYLVFSRGLIETTISMFEIGFNPLKKYIDNDGEWRSGRYIIPVFAKDNTLRNLRLYAVNCTPNLKILNLKDYGSPSRLFPLSLLAKGNFKHMVWVGGEFDCMKLNQELWLAGYNDWIAMTSTAGEGSFEPEFISFFQGMHVYICLDADNAGKSHAQSHANNFFKDALSSGNIEDIRIITLPLAGTKDRKDITDYFVKEQKTINDWMALVHEELPLEFGGMNKSELVKPYIEVDDLTKVVKDRQYIDMRVRVPLTISGQTNKIYHATREYKVTSCPLMTKGECCSLDTQIIPYGNPIFIESCMANRRTMEYALREIACTKKQLCSIEEKSKVVMEEHYANQRIKRLTVIEDKKGRLVNSQELVTIPVYILQPEDCKSVTPQDYIAIGYVRSHPNTRQVCMFIEELEPIKEDWKDFTVTVEAKEHLKIIQDYKMNDLKFDITKTVTKIYESDDILMTILLTYCSPLIISFNGTPIRGWINACIMGDTGTGKTKTYQRISDWLDLGDLFSTLSGSRTGLLYAIRSRGNDWYVQIGRYVMANAKILAIDETQEMQAEEIKKMAKAMDEGWLEVSRVASGGYRTNTRTLFLMNPPHGQKISDYPYGCLVLTKCFHPMFIRRLDLAVFSTGKSDPIFYNKEHVEEKEEAVTKINARVFKSLVYWAWTRNLDQIQWSRESTLACLDEAVRLSKIFGQADDIPLVNPQDFRENLARLSSSFAILSGNFTEDYESVIVTEKHVRTMAKFVELIYSSSSCNLKQHSRNSATRKVLTNDDFPKIAEIFDKVIAQTESNRSSYWREGHHFLQLLLIISDQQNVKARDIQLQLGVGNRWASRHLTIIAGFNLIEFKNSTWKATRKFNLFMQKWQETTDIWDGHRIEKLLSEVQKKRGTYALIQPPDEAEDDGDNRDQQDNFPMEGLGGPNF